MYPKSTHLSGGYPISLLARSGNPPWGVPAWYSPYSYSPSLATSTDLFFHRTHAKVLPRPLFLGSSTGIPHCVCAQSVAVDASQTLKFSFPTLPITRVFPSMDISWAPCTSMCVVKRASLPHRMAPFPQLRNYFMVTDHAGLPGSLSLTPSPHGQCPPWGPTLVQVRQTVTSQPGSPLHQLCSDMCK